MLGAIGGWGLAGVSADVLGEASGVVESGLLGDVGEREAGLSQERQRVFEPGVGEMLAHGLAGALTEVAGEVLSADAELLGDLVEGA